MKKDGRQSRKERDAEILRQMYGGSQNENEPESGAGADEPRQTEESPKTSEKDKRLCPKCGALYTGNGSCKKCGYSGYVPMSDRQILRVKLILYPVFIIIVLLVFLHAKGYI